MFSGPTGTNMEPTFWRKSRSLFLWILLQMQSIFIVILLLVALGTSGGCAIYFDPEVSSVDHVWYIYRYILNINDF